MADEITAPVGLAEPYATAMQLALDFIAEYPAGILAVTAGGSVVQGLGDPLSDLDMWVVVNGDERQRVQKRFNGVPCELFFNPAGRIPRYFAEEAMQGRASSIGLTLDGDVLYDPEGIAHDLRQQAAAMRQAGPQVSNEEIVLRKYLIVDTLDNARDVVVSDPLMSALLCADAVKATLELAYILEGAWTPRDKDLAKRLGEVRPHAVDPLDRFGTEPTVDSAAEVVHSILGVSTFFSWESEPDSG
jgi:hypothetical protein